MTVPAKKGVLSSAAAVRRIDGVNVTRSALRQCGHMNYTGTLYEERDTLDSRALRRLLQEVSGNYTAYV